MEYDEEILREIWNRIMIEIWNTIPKSLLHNSQLAFQLIVISSLMQEPKDSLL